MLVAIFKPFPSQLFSETTKEKLPPLVPTPAPALISPVGFSSTEISIIFWSGLDPSIILVFTSPNKFLDLILAIDWSNFKILKGI